MSGGDLKAPNDLSRCFLSGRQSCKLGALDKVCLVQTARVPVDQDKSSGEVAPDPVLSLPTSFGNIQTPTLQI